MPPLTTLARNSPARSNSVRVEVRVAARARRCPRAQPESESFGHRSEFVQRTRSRRTERAFRSYRQHDRFGSHVPVLNRGRMPFLTVEKTFRLFTSRLVHQIRDGCRAHEGPAAHCATGPCGCCYFLTYAGATSLWASPTRCTRMSFVEPTIPGGDPEMTTTLSPISARPWPMRMSST